MSRDRTTLLQRTAQIRHELQHLEHVQNEAHTAASALRNEETRIIGQLRSIEREEIATYLGAFLPDPAV